MVTKAPDSREASATPAPRPEETPMTRTCLLRSFWYVVGGIL